MERYTTILKIEEIRRLVELRQYDNALKILDTMDVSKIRVITDLSVFADVYTKTTRYEEAMEILLRIYEKTKTRRVLFQLVNLSVRRKDFTDAEKYYGEYILAAPKDSNRFILRYRIDKAKGTDPETLINVLEELKEYDYIEEWAYELAKLYHKSGYKDKCIRECSDIILWFGEGIIVEKARMLKGHYVEQSKIITSIDESKELVDKEEKEIEEKVEEKEELSDSDVYDNDIFNEIAAAFEVSIEEMGLHQEICKENTKVYEPQEKILEREEAIEEPVEEIKEPVEEIEEPVEEIKEPVEEIEEPVEEIKEPVEEIEKPVEEIEEPVEEIEEPVEEIKEPVEEIKEPVEEIEEPVEEIEEPVEEIKEPVEEIKEPVEEIEEPVEEIEEPVEEIKEPVEEIKEPVEEIKEPVEEIEEPVEEIKEPVEEIKEPVEEIEDPVEEIEDPVEEIVAENEKEEIYVPYIRYMGQDVPLSSIEQTKTNEEIEYVEEVGAMAEINPSLGFEELELGEIPELTIRNLEINYIFRNLLLIRGLEESIKDTLKSMSDNLSENNYLVVTGERGTGKTTLIKCISKALYKLGIVKSPKMAIITADKLNKINIFDKKEQLVNGCVVVQYAASISAGTAEQLIEFTKDLESGIIIILEDTKEEIDKMFMKYSFFGTKFNNRIDLSEYKTKDLFALAYNYLDDIDYKLSSEAKEVLKEVVCQIKEEVPQEEQLVTIKEVINEAKERAEKRNMSGLLDVVNRGDYRKAEWSTLIPSDFIEE